MRTSQVQELKVQEIPKELTVHCLRGVRDTFFSSRYFLAINSRLEKVVRDANVRKGIRAVRMDGYWVLSKLESGYLHCAQMTTTSEVSFDIPTSHYISPFCLLVSSLF